MPVTASRTRKRPLRFSASSARSDAIDNILMTQAQQPTALPPPRLVRFLSELAVADIAVSHKNFTERLGRLVDLSGSIALARVHGTLATTTATSGQETGAAVSGESMIEAFLARRAAIIESISKSFAPGKRASWSAFPR